MGADSGCDEWLEEPFDELYDIVLHGAAEDCDAVTAVVRNYLTPDLDYYTESRNIRLVRMASGGGYYGAIHENLNFPDRTPLLRYSYSFTIHHDGYVMLNNGSEAGKQKTERNLALLRKRSAATRALRGAASELLS